MIQQFRYDTVIFDFDGTLANSLSGLTESTNYMLERFNFPKRTEDEVKTYIGNGVQKLIERSLPEGEEYSEKYLEIFKDYYLENSGVRFYDGVFPLLKELKKNDIKTAVLSNKYDAALKALCLKHFDGLIDIALGESENNPPKPSPFGIYKIISALGSKNTVLVGDSGVDLQTALNANIDFIGVTYGYGTKEFFLSNGITELCDKPADILKKISGNVD